MIQQVALCQEERYNMSLWMYALGSGATNKFNQIMDEKRRLAGNIELEKAKAEFSDTADPLADKFSIKDTDIMFNTPNYEKDLKGATASRKRMLWMDSFYNGALQFNKDQWDAAKASNSSGYDHFKHQFLGNAKEFWKRVSQTEKGGNVYQEYNYSGLKDLLPDMWRDLQLLDPASKPEEEVKEGINEAFNVDDEAQIRDEMNPSDLFHIPYKFDKKTTEANKTGFDDYYGIDFGKEVIMNSQYAGLQEQDYERLKGESPWRILVPTYQWMSDTGRMTHAEANKEIAQMQINFGLPDEELIDILATGTKKHDLTSEGGFSTRKKINQVSNTEFTRTQNAKSVSHDIIDKIEQLQGYVNDPEMGTGWAGGINRFFNSVFKDENSMIDQFTALISSIQNSNEIMFIPSGNSALSSTQYGSDSIFGNDYAYANTGEQVRENILSALQNGLGDAKELYKRHGGGTIDLTDPLRMDEEANMGNVKQSMIETLAIGLAFQIAMVEQGSGGKAVSDQDFDRAYQRIKGKWFSSKEDVIATLNQEKFNMSKRLLRGDAISHDKNYGKGVLDWYDRIASERVNVLTEYKNEFKSIPPMAERTQRLINMYTTTGGDQIIDYRYGAAPDVLSEEGLQTILSNFTPEEARKLGIRLSTNDNLNEKSKNNRKVIINNKGNEVENPNKVTTGTKTQLSFAPDLVNKYLKDGVTQGDTNIGTTIDRVIDEIQNDGKKVFFRNDELNVTLGGMTGDDAKEQLRMAILQEWLMKYYKKYKPNNPLYGRLHSQVGLYGKTGVPENQSPAVHDKLWGNE